jgi:hypothetical protein
MGDGLTCAIFVHCGELCVKNYASDGTGTFREGGVTDGSLPRPIGDSPECFSFRSWFALHPVDYLRAKDDFKIGSAPVDVGTTYQLFQARFIRQEFTGSHGSAACNSGCDQNYLAGALVSKAGGDCIMNLCVRRD